MTGQRFSKGLFDPLIRRVDPQARTQMPVFSPFSNPERAPNATLGKRGCHVSGIAALRVSCSCQS